MKEIAKMRKIRIIGIGVIMIIVLALSWHLIDRFSYSKAKPFYSAKMDNDTILRIGIIGDSWVAGGKLDLLLHNELLEKGFKNQILSSGHPGAKSKLIYQNLFEESTNKHSSKFIIENNPDYCIVVAGVNDAFGQVGANFYSHHMLLIINTLLHYKIKPIIVELPDFGIIEATNKMGLIKKVRNKIYAKFTDPAEFDDIKTYREAFVKELETNNLKDSVIQIDFDIVCDDYHKCLDHFKNTSHLSTLGNEELSQTITNELIIAINARQQKNTRKSGLGASLTEKQ